MSFTCKYKHKTTLYTCNSRTKQYSVCATFFPAPYLTYESYTQDRSHHTWYLCFSAWLRCIWSSLKVYDFLSSNMSVLPNRTISICSYQSWKVQILCWKVSLHCLQPAHSCDIVKMLWLVVIYSVITTTSLGTGFQNLSYKDRKKRLTWFCFTYVFSNFAPEAWLTTIFCTSYAL